MKEVAGETLEGRPDLPSDEDGLKRSHSGNSSAAMPSMKVGEKGVARGLRMAGGSVTGRRSDAATPADEEGGEEGGVGGAMPYSE
jgi:hypothetical protein